MRFVGDIAEDAEVRAIASGAITDGAPVLVNADGTVSLASDVSAIGTAVVYDADQVFFPSAVYDTNADRIVIAYQDGGNSYYGTAIVGTISGTSINFGSPVVFKSANTRMFNASFDINANKIVIVYRDSNPGRAIVATVDPSDNSISFGSEATYDATKGNDPHIAYDVNAQKHLITYYDTDEDGRAIVGTVSGTDITFGSSSEFETEDTREPNVIYDVNAQKHLIFYLQYLSGGTDTPAKARVATISGTSVSFGTIATISTNVVDTLAGAYDVNAQKSVLVYRDQTSSTAKARVATISGTSVSFGTEAEFDDGQAVSNDATYDASLQKTVFTFKDQGNSSKGSFKSGTISGTDITFGSTIVFEEGSTSYTSVNYDPDSGKNIVAFVDAGDSSKGKAIVINSFNPISLTSENFIGFANAAYADGQKATVKTTGSIARNVPPTAASVPTPTDRTIIHEGSLVRRSATISVGGGKFAIIYSLTDAAVIYTVGTINSTTNTVSYSDTSSTSITAYQISGIFETNANRIVIAYENATDNKGYAAVGTISGNTISFGTPVIFENASVGDVDLTFDSASNKVVIAYRDVGNSNYGTAIVGTIDNSDNSISFGTPTVFESAYVFMMEPNNITYDSNAERVVIVYRDQGNSAAGTAIVGTVSGTSISFGTPVVVDTGNSTDYLTVVFNPVVNKVLITYDASDKRGKSKIGTVSGTSISLTGVYIFNNDTNFDGTIYQSSCYDTTSNTHLIVYRDNTLSGASTNHVYGIIGTMNGDGSAISYGTEFAIDLNAVINPGGNQDGNGWQTQCIYDSTTERFIVTYDFDVLKKLATSMVIPIGGGIPLTIGQQYFVQTDGSLDTSADDPSVIAGTAIGASELIVKG